MNSRKKSAIEALIGSQGLTLIGFATVPFVAWLSGASVSAWQGAQMGVYFAVGRFFTGTSSGACQLGG